MGKFFNRVKKDNKKDLNPLKYKDFSIESLKKSYNSIINEYTSGMFVNLDTINLIKDLELIKLEIESRLSKLNIKIRDFEQKYNESIHNSSSFNMKSYTNLKKTYFLLEGLYKTVVERLEAMKETIGIKR